MTRSKGKPPKHTHKKKHDEGQEGADHWQDIESKDEREIGEAITAVFKQSHIDESASPLADPKVNPLGPATFHGNEPSKGAKVDAELKAEDEELLRRKGKA
ncbi:uncharacterized protein EDB91DRAFT_1252554 [Suillus paluster]|uniref:uncharacterized protein n=1 Tax=Suillus paluster TaxID=48578 RepID=UPI001B86CF70|nr:uncharacterized protein EDB91DRAFT_1252554 [Suillus paluster]KAG1730692.1 hypothetical protein EDB91DRAFT_1252554 [Suillus paluster]